MSNHTPTPWAVQLANSGPRIVSGKQVIVVGIGPDLRSNRANAAFIVLACNAYNDLVKEVAHWKGLYEDEHRDHEATLKHAERERDEFSA